MTSKFKVGDEVVHRLVGVAVVVGVREHSVANSYLIRVKGRRRLSKWRYSEYFKVSHLEDVSAYYHASEDGLTMLTPKFKGN